MKHPNKSFTTILSNYHVKTCKVCFAIGRFVSMLSIYELMTKFGVLWTKLVQLYSNRPVLTSQFDVSKLLKQLRSVIRIHLDHSAKFGPLPWNVCVTVGHNVAFNSMNREVDTKCIKSRQTRKRSIETNLCQQSFQTVIELQAKYAFQLEDLFQFHQYTNLWQRNV